jgi:hypothetical protein
MRKLIAWAFMYSLDGLLADEAPSTGSPSGVGMCLEQMPHVVEHSVALDRGHGDDVAARGHAGHPILTLVADVPEQPQPSHRRKHARNLGYASHRVHPVPRLGDKKRIDTLA